MTPARLASALLAALVLLPPAPPARALADEPAKLRDAVLDSSLKDQSRLKAARDLEKKDPGMLGDALISLAEKKAAVNLPFLASLVITEVPRHLRLVGIHAAWQSSPETAAATFLEKAAAEDDAQAIRALEAVGLIAPMQKDRSVHPKLLEIAKGPRVFPAIEAIRAVNRSMDPKTQRDLAQAAVAVTNDHVRKHLVWAVLDLVGSERTATKVFEGMRRPGKEGENANECVRILDDKQATPCTWNPFALKDVGTWWAKGRPKGNRTVVDFGDPGTNSKVEGWLTEMRKVSPLFEHLVGAAVPKVGFRKSKDPEIFDLRSKTLELDASEIARAQSDWQGSYVLARDSGIALSTQFGEPCTGHRGWEPAYVDVYPFMKATNQAPGKFADFIDEQLAKKPWP